MGGCELEFIKTNENELTKDSQSPFKSAGAIKSKVAIGVFGCGTKNIKYIKNETLNWIAASSKNRKLKQPIQNQKFRAEGR